MTEWWTGLGPEQQIYYGIALVATGLLVLQTLLLLIGGAGDLADAGDFDMEGPEEHPSGAHVLSVRTVVAFFVGFGWTGVIASANPISEVSTTVAVAVAVGLGFGAVIFYLMRFLHDLRHSGTLNYENALGEIGTVYLPIPAGMQGSGKIQVVVQGRLKEIQALTRHTQRLENRARVRVVELLDETTLVVEPLADSGATQED